MFKLDKSPCPDADRKYECEADPYSMGSLIAWMERQEPGARYCYGYSEECLLHDYGVSVGLAKLSDHTSVWRQIVDGFYARYGFNVDHAIAMGIGHADFNHTYNSALSRARKYVSGTP